MSHAALPHLAALCIDFETANFDAASSIALGLCGVDKTGSILFKQSWLYRPEGRLYIRPDFIDIHGITPAMIKNKPRFRELWDEIGPYLMAAPLLVAHNAGFDRRVLDGTLARAEIELPRKHWQCTVQLSRRTWPHLYNHKLSTVAAHIGFALDHHDAGSDSEACAHILHHAGFFAATESTQHAV